MRGTINELVAARAASQFKLDEAGQMHAAMIREVETAKAETSRAKTDLGAIKIALAEVTELNTRL